MQAMSTMLDSMSMDFDIPPTMPTQKPNLPAPKQQLNPKPPVVNPIKPVPENKILGFSNLPDLPSVPTDIPSGDIKDKDDEDEETDFDELLNRFEDLKKNKK